MKFARFWAKESAEAVAPNGRRVKAISRGWSDDDIESARSSARETAMKVAQSLAAGRPDRRDYLYGERPLPEPVLLELANGGQPAAVVTRNSYGAAVLNTRSMMFVDIDASEPAPQPAATDVISTVLSLFGIGGPKTAAPTGAIQRAEGVAAQSGLALRVYQTAGGHRLIITNRLFSGASAESESLLNQFGSDPLYIRLCRSQDCFRARLSPKPWRCGVRSPPVQFPYTTDDERRRFARWEAEYNAAAARFATCRLVGTRGATGTDPRFRSLIDHHDQATRATSGLPLA